MLKINKINESFVQLDGDYDELLTISNYFSFYTPNYKWSPKYKAGIWDGKIRLLNLKNGNLPIGLYPRLKSFCKDLNIKTNINFKKTSINFSEEQIEKYASEKLKISYKLRDYQTFGIKTAFKQQKAVILSPTASGKSIILYVITKLFLDLNKNSKVLLIVPTVSLVEQMKGDFIEYDENTKISLKDEITTIYSGQEKIWNKKLIISTWQSLNTITDKKIFESFGCVLVDEVHSAQKAVIIKSIIEKCSLAQMKIGVSGTIDDEKISRIQLEGLFGKIHQFTTTKKLIKNKTLSNLKINIFHLKYPDECRRVAYKLTYFDEMSYLVDSELRLEFLLKIIKTINKNILILFKHLKYGKLIYERLKENIPDRNIYYVAGSTKSEIRENVRKLTSIDSNAIVVASLGVFATGINIPGLDYCIFAQPFKSKIKTLQSIGRILRKTHTKSIAYLIDIADDLTWRRKKNYSFKHALERISIYNKEGFEYKINEKIL